MANGEIGEVRSAKRVETARSGQLMLRATESSNDVAGRFDELYRECRPELVRYAERRNGRDPEILADLALLDVYRTLDRLRSDHPRVIWAYLYRALDNHLRREASKFSPELRDDLESVGGSQTFEDDVVGELSLDDMLALLSTNQEMALRPKFEENMSAEEIGVEIGKSAAAVRQLQYQGIRRLRRILYVAVTLFLVVLAAVLSDRDVAVDRSPATESEQPPLETTVPDSAEESSEVTLRIPGEPDSAGSGLVSGPGDGAVDPADGATADGETTGESTSTTLDPPVDGAPPTTGAPVIDGGTSDQGEVERPPGAFALVNIGSGQCLDQPASQDDAARVIQWTCHGDRASNQLFRMVPGRDGFMLAFTHSDKCLDESAGVVRQWSCQGGDNQLFKWNGSQLQTTGSGLCLTLLDIDPADPAGTLRTEPCVNSPAQQFRVERYGAPEPPA